MGFRKVTQCVLAASWSVQPVPHGEVHVVWSESKSVGAERRRVYTPSGYASSRATFPVLCLLHGNGQNENDWTEVGRANFFRFEGTAEELRSLSHPSIVGEVNDPARAAEVLSRHGIVALIEPSRIVISDHGGLSPAGVNSLLVHSGIAVSEFFARRPTLE